MTRLAALLIVAVAWLQAVPPPRDTAATPKTGTGAITGRVLAGNTDAGVAGARVYLVPSGPDSPQRTVLTDREGRFTLDKLAAGAYRVAVTPPEFNARLISLEERTRQIDVADGASVTAPVMRLPFGAAISGRVVDDRGEPLANVEVYAMGQRFGEAKLQRLGQGWPAHTDDQGRFRAFGLPAGEVILVAHAGERFSGIAGGPDGPAGFVTTYYPEAVSEAAATRITLRQGADLDGMDIRMTRVRTFRIRGTIVDSHGAPFTGAVGLGHSSPGASGGVSWVEVGPDGTFDASGLLPGSYMLIAGIRGFGGFAKNQTTEYAMVPVEISDGDVEDLAIITRPGPDLTVRVVFDPETPRPLPANFGLIGWMARGTSVPPPQAEIDADSTVVLPRALGPIVIRPLSQRRTEWYLKGVYLGERDITDTPTEFAPADATRVRVVVTNRGAIVSGTVTDAAGKPAQDCEVVIFPEDRAAWIDHSSSVLTATVDKSGAYRITGLRAGRYRIAAVERRRTNELYPDPGVLLAALAKDATSITVTENEQRVVDLTIKIADK